MNRKMLHGMIMLCTLCGIESQAQTKITSENPKSTHTIILEQMLKEKGLENKSVEIMIVDFPPLGVSAAHRHPCPTFGYVISGELVSVFEGKSHIYKAGDSFYEAPEGLHNSTMNPSATTHTKLLAFFIKENNGATVIPERN